MVTQYWMPETMKKMEERHRSTHTNTRERSRIISIARTPKTSVGASRGDAAGDGSRLPLLRLRGLVSASWSEPTSSVRRGTEAKSTPSGTSTAPCAMKGQRHPPISAPSVCAYEVTSPPDR